MSDGPVAYLFTPGRRRPLVLGTVAAAAAAIAGFAAAGVLGWYGPPLTTLGLTAAFWTLFAAARPRPAYAVLPGRREVLVVRAARASAAEGVVLRLGRDCRLVEAAGGHIVALELVRFGHAGDRVVLARCPAGDLPTAVRALVDRSTPVDGGAPAADRLPAL
ncbi:MAG TPA: hypothetical protein VF796_18500 [Humisphaera sp.]